MPVPFSESSFFSSPVVHHVALSCALVQLFGCCATGSGKLLLSLSQALFQFCGYLVEMLHVCYGEFHTGSCEDFDILGFQFIIGSQCGTCGKGPDS